jgi:NitT/TauT family transport system ATP-binding protein
VGIPRPFKPGNLAKPVVAGVEFPFAVRSPATPAQNQYHVGDPWLVQQLDKPHSAPTLNPASATDSRPTAMQIRHATKYYKTSTGAVHALEDINLEIKQGEFTCILGPSGCGKTTLLWGLSGLHELTKGDVILNGTPVKGPRPEIGMIFQEANLLPWRDLMKNILFPFEIKKLDPKPYRDRIQGLIDEVGLSGFENKYPRELSGGMQQRASIVRCLSFDPLLILMDEPFGALDAFTRDEMNLLIQKIWMETGKTIVFVTHNVTEAIFLSDRVVVLSPRPGRLNHIFDINIPRPRSIEQTFTPEFIKLVLEVKATILHGSSPAR